jgi:esterase
MADDVLHLADQLKIDKFSLLGHSMGGRTALVFGLKHPQRVEKLIIVDMSPFTMSGEFKQMKCKFMLPIC